MRKVCFCRLAQSLR